MNRAVPAPNATFLIFKVSGKYYETARGHLPQDVFRPFYDPGKARDLMLVANNGRMPGLGSDGADMAVVVQLDDGIDFGWPIFLRTKTWKGDGFDLIAHLHRQRAFSLNTFGPGDRAAGISDHIRKELTEIEAEPTDLKEWVDVILL